MPTVRSPDADVPRSSAERLIEMLGVVGNPRPGMLPGLVDRESGRRECRIGKHADWHRDDIRRWVEPVVDCGAAVRAEMRMHASAAVADPHIFRRPAFNGDAIA